MGCLTCVDVHSKMIDMVANIILHERHTIEKSAYACPKDQDANQTVCLCRLISVFIFRCLDSLVIIRATSK